MGVRAPRLVPSRLGRFAILGPLPGSTAGLLEAWDPVRDERVALESLGDLDPRDLGRFERELRSLAASTHENLLGLHEVFFDDDTPYYSMERAFGVPWLEWVRPGGELDPSRLRHAIGQLAHAIAALHAHGYLHRRLRASSVLVTVGGRVVLLDLGGVIRRAVAADDPHGRGDCELGTQADWAALGALLHDSLTTSTGPDRAPEGPPDLVRAGRELLDAESGSARTPTAILGSLVGPGTLGTRAPTPAGGFIGRDLELARLEQAWAQAVAGRAVSVLVHGPAGAGKTTLLERFVRAGPSRSPLRVVWARCREAESTPYRAFDELVEFAAARVREDPTLVEWVEPTAIDALARVFPVVARTLSGRPSACVAAIRPGPRGAASMRELAFSTLRRLLRLMTRTEPVVVVIDDMHWCDADSLALWIELARPPEPPCLVLIGAYRDDQPFPGIERVLDACPRAPLAVRRLGAEAAARLAVALLQARGVQAPRLADRLARECEGSPLWLEELVAHACRSPAHFDAEESALAPATTLAGLLDDRLARLPAPARGLLDVLALAGRPLLRSVLLQAGLGPIASRDPLDTLRRAGLVRSTGVRPSDPVEIGHDRVRDHVLARLDVRRRRPIHLALARALGGSSPPEQLAVHFADAGADEPAITHALQAAARAEAELAFDAAARWHERALARLTPDDTRRADVLCRLAHARADAGHAVEGARALIQAAQVVDDVDQRRRMRRLAAHWLAYSGDLDSCEALLRELLAELGLAPPQSGVRGVLTLLALRARIRLRGLRWRPPTVPTPALDLHRIDLCWAVGFLVSWRPIPGAVWLARHLLYALEAGDASRIAPGLAFETLSRLISGRICAAEGKRAIDRAAEIARDSGDDEATAWVEFVRPVMELGNGEWARARASAQRAAALLRQHAVGVGLPILTCRHIELWCRYQLGEWSDLAADLHAFAITGEDNPHRDGARALLAVPFALAEDRPAAALSTLAELEARVGRGLVPRSQPYVFVGSVLARVYDGDLEAAYAWACKHRRAFARGLRFRPGVARAFHQWALAVAAIAAAAAGNRKAARDARRALDALARETFLPAPALAELGRAGLDAACSRRDAARMRLARAARAFDGLDMRMHAAIARAHLGALRPDADGERMRARALAFMRGMGVVRPDRLALTFAPGFEPALAHALPATANRPHGIDHHAPDTP